jgi:galactokinase
VAGVDALAGLPELLQRRARHVVTENARVAQAVACRTAHEFGRLMNASHASLRDDYAVSTPELDRLVALLQAQEGVHGARLTGAGFGGACVALCDEDAVQPVAAAVLQAYAAAGHRGAVLVPPVSELAAV